MHIGQWLHNCCSGGSHPSCHIVTLLETNTYVRCILVDYSKAFDTINHEILFAKLSKLPVPYPIIKWIMNFLTGRLQAVVSQ